MNTNLVLAALDAAQLSEWAQQAAEYIPENLRQYVDPTAVLVFVSVVIIWQVVASLRTLRLQKAFPFWRAVTIWSSIALAPFLVGFTILLWSMPSDSLAVQIARVIAPYESIRTLCYTFFGIAIWANERRLRRKLARSP